MKKISLLAFFVALTSVAHAVPLFHAYAALSGVHTLWEMNSSYQEFKKYNKKQKKSGLKEEKSFLKSQCFPKKMLCAKVLLGVLIWESTKDKKLSSGEGLETPSNSYGTYTYVDGDDTEEGDDFSHHPIDPSTFSSTFKDDDYTFSRVAYKAAEFFIQYSDQKLVSIQEFNAAIAKETNVEMILDILGEDTFPEVGFIYFLDDTIDDLLKDVKKKQEIQEAKLAAGEGKFALICKLNQAGQYCLYTETPVDLETYPVRKSVLKTVFPSAQISAERFQPLFEKNPFAGASAPYDPNADTPCDPDELD